MARELQWAKLARGCGVTWRVVFCTLAMAFTFVIACGRPTVAWRWGGAMTIRQMAVA